LRLYLCQLYTAWKGSKAALYDIGLDAIDGIGDALSLADVLLFLDKHLNCGFIRASASHVLVAHTNPNDASTLEKVVLYLLFDASNLLKVCHDNLPFHQDGIAFL
jgi:hypothetical protein